MTQNDLVYFLYKSGIGTALDYARDYASFTRSNLNDHFSQAGEDEFLRSYFANRTGTYIDIGGNHPFRLSNTYSLYRRGWNGLVVEPIRRHFAKHKRFRPKDIQINAAVGDAEGDLTFCELVPSVLSTCDKSEADLMISRRVARLFRQYTVPVHTVAELHQKHLQGRPVQFLSVDTEGHDLAVLHGVDWNAMRPEVVICEANEDQAATSVTRLLSGLGYKEPLVTGCNLIFVQA